MRLFLLLLVTIHGISFRVIPAFGFVSVAMPRTRTNTNSNNILPAFRRKANPNAKAAHHPFIPVTLASASAIAYTKLFDTSRSSNNAEEDSHSRPSTHRNRNLHGGLHARPANGHLHRRLRSKGLNIRLLRPVAVRPLEHDHTFSTHAGSAFTFGDDFHFGGSAAGTGIGRRIETKLQISSGLTFDDGDQLLVSAQKPLGILLEERGGGDDPHSEIDENAGEHMGCIVSEIVEGGAADKAGVREGDLLVAIQNVDVGNASFEEVMQRIQDSPRVVNLRFWRKER